MTRRARRRLFLTTALAGTLLHGAAHAADLPVPTNPAEPGLTYNGAGTRLDVDLANTNRILNWNSFDVAATKVVNFTTPDTASKYAVLNRVAPGDPSDIFGTISSSSNVAVWLVNPSGITFGATGSFSGGSLVLTTAAVSDTDWGNAIAGADPANFLVPLTGAPVPVTDAMTGITTGAIALASGSTITTTGGRFAAAAQSVTAAGTIIATGSEAELVAATDLALPFGAGSPLGVRIDKGTGVGRVTAQGTAQIDAAVVRLAGASTGAQAAYLLQVDDNARLTATAVGGKVILAAGVAGDGVTLGATPANVAGAASIHYDGKAAAAQTGGTAALGASGDIVTTTANGTIDAAGALGITAAGNATIGAVLSSANGDVTILAGGATLVQAAVGAGGAFSATGASVSLGTAGSAVAQAAKGAVTITANAGLLAGLDGLTLQSGSAGANAALTLSQAGTGGILFAPGTELIGGTFAAGPPVAYGFGAAVLVSQIAAGQPLTLGNVHARALTLPAGLTGTITAGDIVVNDTLTLTTTGAIRLRSGTSRTGDVALTATGDVTGLARATAATDGRLSTGYDRADLSALAAGKTVTVGASTAQLGTLAAGTGTTVVAGEQVAVDAKAIDVVGVTAANGTLRLTSTVGDVRLGTGSAGIDGTITAAADVRLGSLAARTGNVSVTATAGDVSGLALPAAATDGRLLAGFGRAGLTAQAATRTVAATATAGNAQLATITAGAGTTAAPGDQTTVDARVIDVTTATANNGALRLSATVGEVRLGTGTGGSDATVAAATSARIGSLTATRGNVFATASGGDVTGLALTAAATDGRLVADYGRADLTALAANGAITVMATAGTAQLGTATAGTGATTVSGDELAVDATAIDVATATASNGALRLTAGTGEVRLGTGTGGTDATVAAATSARIGSLTARNGNASATATGGDVTGRARATPATDGRLVAGYDRADVAAQAVAKTVTVTATAGDAQLGTAAAGTGATTASGDQLAVDAQAIDVTTATAQNGAFRLTSTVGEVRLGTGTGGTNGTVDAATNARIGSITARIGSIAATARGGDATGLALAAPATDGRLVAGYGRTDLTAQAAGQSATVTAAGGNAQLGTVIAGAGATTGSGDQVAVDARAIDVTTATAQNARLRLTSTQGEVRLVTGTAGASATVAAATNARVGDLTTRTGAIAITATSGDATGLALATAATDTRPETGYGLATLDAGTGIAVAASDDVQLGTIRAATTIDVDAHPADPGIASADEVAWLGGTVTATAGHYRVTGGSVVLGAPGGIGQSAGADLIVRSLAGDISGGAGLALASGVGSTSAANPLILYAAGAITLPGDATLTAGAGRFADIGLAVAPGGSVTLGTAAARRIGTAVIDVAQPTGYRVDRALVLPNPISARKIVTTADLVIDTTGGGTPQDITLDEAQSTAGGINIATTGDLKGRLLSDPPALYQRTRLTALDGIVVNSGLALLDTVTAGTGVSIAAGRLDALGITGNAGDVVLRTAGDMRIDRVIAHGDGGSGPATLLADPTIPLSAFATPGPIRTAGDIFATASGDLSGTPAGMPGAFGLASFTATDGAVTLVSDATGTGQGLLSLDTVTAGGTAAGHTDASLTGRQIEVATGVDSTNGSTFVTARQLGSQTQVGATIARATAKNAVTVAVGYGTAAGGTADNGSLRFGTVRTTSGDVTITAQDGSVTGLAGTTDGLDPAHARPTLSAGGNVVVTAGRLVQLGELAGRDVRIAAGDDVLSDVTQQGSVTHQDGAIDIAHLVARGALTLTAAHGPTADGVSGIRLGALASGLADGGAASQAGTSATLRTLGTLGDIVVGDGLTAAGDLAGASIANIRAVTLTATTGGITLAATGGDVTGLVLPAAAADGRLIPGYGRADLATLAAAQPIAVTAAAGTAQLGTVTAGTGTTTAAGDQLAFDARAIDVTTATAQNGALRLTATVGEVRLATGTAGTHASIGAATSARIGTLATRTGSIGITATAGDVTGLALATPITDGRPSPAYGRADLTAAAAATDVTVTANAGAAQLGTVTAGSGDTTAPLGGIAIDAALVDVTTATAQNAALRLTSSVGEVGLVTGIAGTDATVGAATSARIGTLTARTGSIGVIATAGDVTGLALMPAATDGRMVPDYGRADLTAEAAATDVTVAANVGTAQLGTVTAGTGDTTATDGGIAVTARTIDLITADARNAALRLTSTVGETRLVTGSAGTDAHILAADNARIGTLTTRTGSIAVTATAGDVTGLVRPAAAVDGRLVAGYDRADLTALAAVQSVAVKAAAGNVQLGTAQAGIGPGTAAGEGVAVDAQGIDVTTATAQNAALRLTATASEVRLATGNAGTDATILAASNARIGALTTRTGSIAVTAGGGDVTGLALTRAADDGRLVPTYGRAALTAEAAGKTIAVMAVAGTAQLDAITAGTDLTPSAGDQVAVNADAIDVVTATAQNGALRLTSTAGEVRLATGNAGTDANIGAATNARIGTLTTRTGSIMVAAGTGDVTGLGLAAPATDGRMVSGYDRADLTAQVAGGNVTVTAAAGTAQLGTVGAGAGDATAATGGIAVDARAIDVAAATAQNAALRLTSTASEARLAAGTAGTDATIAAATSARIGMLTTRTGSIGVTATAGDATGLALAPAAAADGRLVADYGRADLTAQAAATTVAVAAAGAAQLGTVAAGTGDATAASGGIGVTAGAIDIVTATAQNAALALTSITGETRLAAGTAGTDAAILAATSARIGSLATRTGSIAITATAGDVTGLALATPMTDGRPVTGYGRAALAALTAATNVTVTAAPGSAQLDSVVAGSGDVTAASGGIAVDAGTIDIVDADAQNAALRLTSSAGETRLVTGNAGTDATIGAATSARIGSLAARTGSIAATAAAGDVTGLALPAAATDGRLVAGYGRADLTASAAAQSIAVTAAAGTAQLGTASAGSGGGSAAEQLAVDARAIDVTAATAKDGALRLASSAGETRLGTGTAATDATIRAATSARIGDLTANTGAIAVTATAGDVTGLAGAAPTSFGRANLTAPAPTKSITVTAAAGTAQLGTVTAGPATAAAGGGGIAVTARAIDAATTDARNGALALTATADRLTLANGTAATTATLDKQGSGDALHISGSLGAAGKVTLASTTDIDLPATPAAIGSGDTLVVRNSGANATSIGTVPTAAGFALSEAEVNSLKAPKVMIDARANSVALGGLTVAAAAGSSEIDLLGTGGFTLTGAVANMGGGARTLQIGGAVASTDAPDEAAIQAGTTLARSISAEIDHDAALNWTGGTVDLRAGTILFGNQALRTAAVGTPEAIAVNLVARANSALYTGALNTPIQTKVFLTALKLRVVYTGYALFQNTNLPAVATGVVLGAPDKSVTATALQLFSTGETPANSFALFGTINGFDGRTAGLLPADVIDFANTTPRVVRITQANSRVNGCVIGSPDAGCLVSNSPPPNFQLFDERQILLFGTADDAGLTFDPLIGTNNESLIGDIDSATLGINSIDCSVPGTRDCPATGEKP